MILFNLAFIPLLIFVNGWQVLPIAVAVTSGSFLATGVDNTCFSRYLTTMPIKPSKLILAQYIIYTTALLAGVAMAVVCVFIIGGNLTIGFNILLLVLGIWVTLYAITGPGKIIKNYWLVILPLWVTIVIGQLYLVFGATTIHNTIRRAQSYGEIMESPIFYDTTRWLIFMGCSLTLFVLSYFAAVVIYKKFDYKERRISIWNYT